MTLRALALELNRHRDWTLATGVRPMGTGAARQDNALARSFAVAHALALLSHREGIAESVSWDAVKNRPFSDSGVGFLVLVAPLPQTATPLPQAIPSPPPPPPGKK